MQITQSVQCPVRGFEHVTVEYNLMATEEQADAFIRKAGGDGTHEPVIVQVTGWDSEAFGPDPWDPKRSPMAFRVWAARKGWGQAAVDWLNDPNS